MESALKISKGVKSFKEGEGKKSPVKTPHKKQLKVSDDYLGQFNYPEKILQSVSDLIAFTGDDPTREGLRDTPLRVVKSYQELFSGYKFDPMEVLKTTFSETEGYQDPVFVKNLSFFSTCEHHLLPFFGVAQIAYVPNPKVVGLSKIARVLEILSKRLQMQERLTQEICNTISVGLKTESVAVIVTAEHLCMSMRGIKQPGSKTTTMKLTGLFNQRPELVSLLKD